MGDQLSMLDTMFLELEQAQDSSHMHIGVALVFDPPPDGTEPTLDELVRRFDERIGAMPRFAQRLSDINTDPIRWLTWEPMEDFDPAEHMRRATLPAPGGQAEMEEWLGDFWSHRLDRHRPLWEVTLVDGLDGGRWMLATKAHHCLVDGVGSIDVGMLMLDDVDVDALAREEPGGDDTGGSRFWLTPGLVLRGVRAGLGAVTHPRDALEKLRGAVELIVKEELIAAPQTSLNRELTGARHYRTRRFSLEDAKRIGRRHDATVNDVVLAACAGGLRALLLSRDEEPPPGIRAQVPVNIRSGDQEHALGNAITTLFVELPVEEEDALTRLITVRDKARAMKRGNQGKGGKAIADLTDIGPPLFGIMVSRSMFGSSRMFNLTITNVPGPQEELTALGATLVEALPFVPLFAEHTIGIAVAGYNGGLVIGVSGDRHCAPDIDVLADGIEQSLNALLASVGAHQHV